jgi:lysophospholipase L1-like esterase
MKKLFLALCGVGWGLAASAQTNAPISTPPSPAATAPATTPDKPAEPTSSTTPDNTRYLNNPKLLEDCEARLAAFNDKPCDLIFIGASNIAGWSQAGKAVWNELYAPRHALNFGVEGDKTQNVLWRLNNMEIQNLKPKVAVILIGSNNIANTSHEIADGVQAVIANTQEAFPGVKIILISVMPNERANDTMMQANSIIKNYADDTTIYYLDLVPLMPPVTITNPDGSVDSSWKGLGKDHLHLNAEGYKIWSDAMEPLLTKLLAGK